ncbi:MAG TPA: hypothetical protein PLZ45_16380 [Ferruginibacter sp.]|nr:hypothetical protein [Ferruginibacter sp.]
MLTKFPILSFVHVGVLQQVPFLFPFFKYSHQYDPFLFENYIDCHRSLSGSAKNSFK